MLLYAIPGTVEDTNLENTVSSILSDIDLTVGLHGFEACHRIGLSNKTKSKKQLLK